ncbi:MAG: hypothetical protein Q4G70_13150 [Pseudomonadota bacterium]|nr:hypothetical protein [Pseudomonadota bacterium]
MISLRFDDGAARDGHGFSFDLPLTAHALAVNLLRAMHLGHRHFVIYAAFAAKSYRHRAFP